MAAKTVGIIHHSLNTAGGGEILSLTLASALKEAGYRVMYYTSEPTNWNYVKDMTGLEFRPDGEHSLFKFRFQAFGIYKRLATGFLALTAKADLTINTHGDATPLAAADITYMHYPTFSLWYESPANVKYLKSTFWKIYFIPYHNIQKKLVRKLLASKRCGLIVTNSSFSKDAIRRYVGRDSAVVYPPIRVDEYLPLSKSTERENLVVCISRFTPEKRLEDVLFIASMLRRARFVLVGSTKSRIAKSYFAKLRELAKELGLANVHFLPDAPHAAKLKVLSRAKVFLHCMRNEHFGIAVVEGMAAGCVPVVHRSGGPWIDILERQQGLHGYSYASIDEATHYIAEVVESGALRSEIAERNRSYVLKFSEQAFKSRMLALVERVLRAKEETR